MLKDTKKILSVKLKKGTANCFVLFDNGEFLECSNDIILKFALCKDLSITNEIYDKICQEQRIISLKQAAYNFAAYKPRTEKQVADKLKTKDFESDDIKKAILFLKEFKMLDDRVYARSFINDYLKRKAVSERKIFIELLKKGISKDLAQESVALYYPKGDNFELAEKAARKKLRALNSKPADKRRNALINYLLRQGFEWDVVKKVSNELLTVESNQEYE